MKKSERVEIERKGRNRSWETAATFENEKEKESVTGISVSAIALTANQSAPHSLHRVFTSVILFLAIPFPYILLA